MANLSIGYLDFNKYFDEVGNRRIAVKLKIPPISKLELNPERRLKKSMRSLSWGSILTLNPRYYQKTELLYSQRF
jgi:hypothetical protein